MKRNNKSPKKKTKSRSKPVKKRPEEETMDRATMKDIASQLSAAGQDVRVLKTDSDEVLLRKINEAVQKLPDGEILRKLESIDPKKLETVLKRDCIGVFVDFSDISCVRCADASTCVRTFINNLRSRFDSLNGALADPKAEISGPSNLKENSKKVSASMVPVTRYERDRLVFVRDVPNPNPKGDDYHDTIQRILDDQPDNLGELRAIVEQDFDLESDGDFMKFVSALRDPREGVIKLDVDLRDDDKVALRKAGYEI